MKTERILRNTPSTLKVVFYGDETAVDPDGNAVTFAATKADGTVLVAETSVGVIRTATGSYSYVLPGQANLNHLTVTWGGTIGGNDASLSYLVEIVGGFYFTIPELRAYDSALTVAKYPYETCVDRRHKTEVEFDDNTGRAFVPRFGRETLTGDGGQHLWLAKPDVFTLTKLTVDGVDKLSWQTTNALRLDAEHTKHLYLTDVSGLYFADGAVIEVEYEYGLRSVPVDIHEMALKRTKHRLASTNSRIDERATVMDVQGFGRFNLATPGYGRFKTGIPDVDFVLNKWEYLPGGIL